MLKPTSPECHASYGPSSWGLEKAGEGWRRKSPATTDSCRLDSGFTMAIWEMLYTTGYKLHFSFNFSRRLNIRTENLQKLVVLKTSVGIHSLSLQFLKVHCETWGPETVPHPLLHESTVSLISFSRQATAKKHTVLFPKLENIQQKNSRT